METSLSLRSQAIKHAVDTGYLKVDTEAMLIYGKRGKPIKQTVDTKHKHPYASVAVKFGSKVVRVDVHRIMAYLKFGIVALEHGAVIDHTNNDKLDNRPQNLEITSHTVNLDKARSDGWFPVIVDGEVVALCRSASDKQTLLNKYGR